MPSDYLSFDGFRALLVLALAIGQAAMGYWPELRRWPETVRIRSARHSVRIVPVSWAFAIWGVIFAACFAFAVWQALPAQLADPVLRRIGWWAALVFALTILWEWHVPRRDLDWTSVAVIVAALGGLLVIVFQLEAAEPHDRWRYWLAAAPFQLFAGWISAATFVNLGSTLKRGGAEVGRALNMLLLLSAAALGVAIAAVTGAIAYAAAVAWALVGVVVANRTRDHDAAIAAVAAAAIPLVLGAAWFGGR